MKPIRNEIRRLRETQTRLHRRCQQAEAALADFCRIMARPPDEQGIRFVLGSMGRALLAWAYTKACFERDEAQKRVLELEKLRDNATPAEPRPLPTVAEMEGIHNNQA